MTSVIELDRPSNIFHDILHVYHKRTFQFDSQPTKLYKS
jgi:hypothetical protein